MFRILRRPSSEVGLRPVLQVVADPEPLGVVHRKGVQLVARDEAQVGRLVGDGQLAAGDTGGEADVELTAYFAVGVGDDVTAGRAGLNRWGQMSNSPSRAPRVKASHSAAV